MCQAITAMIATAFWPSWTMLSLLVGWLGAKRKLAGLSLNREASQKELEGVRKMAWLGTLPRRSSGRKSAAKNTLHRRVLR
jgi:hypothetical protein